MPAFKDYSGAKIGRVDILSFHDTRGASRWKCRCDCGTQFICYPASFKRGATFECKKCMMERRRGVDLTGKKFGRWTVIGREFDEHNKTMWVVKCDCGSMGKVPRNKLGTKNSMSCGCLGRKLKSKWANPTLYPPAHGVSGSPIYHIRTRIIHSCRNPKHSAYKFYGKCGYTVCDLWVNSALDFVIWAISLGWKSGYTIALKDGAWEYNPENCFVMEQGEYHAMLTAKHLTYNGKTQPVWKWAQEVGRQHESLLRRLRKMPIEAALFEKKHANSGRRSCPKENEQIKKWYLKDKLSCAEIGRRLGKTYTTISKRLKNLGVEVVNDSSRRLKPKSCNR